VNLLGVVSHQGDQGPMLLFFNIFAEKFSEKMFLTQNKGKLCKILIITLVFEKNANFFTENCRKSQKIVTNNIDPRLGNCLRESVFSSVKVIYLTLGEFSTIWAIVYICYLLTLAKNALGFFLGDFFPQTHLVTLSSHRNASSELAGFTVFLGLAFEELDYC
jgi:hypothetical protein